jgi:hypothetical protein
MKQEVTAWIIQHYGHLSVDSKPLYIASVPVMGGVAVGTGFTEQDSYLNLYKDLTSRDWPETNDNDKQH